MNDSELARIKAERAQLICKSFAYDMQEAIISQNIQETKKWESIRNQRKKTEEKDLTEAIAKFKIEQSKNEIAINPGRKNGPCKEITI